MASQQKKFDVFGIGNTLMDLMIQVDDEQLDELKLKKGVMHLLEEEKVEDIVKRFTHSKIVPSGATTNTLLGIGALGGKCILFGKVGKGIFGNLYEEIITKEGITSRLLRCDKSNTGKVLNFVTPDAERTFGVNLGAAVNIEDNSVLEKDLEESRYFYFTGYEMESVSGAVNDSLFYSKKHNVRIAMDLADPELVKRNKDSLKKIVRDHIDILFMNDAEAKSFTGLEPEEAAKSLRKYVRIAVVKIGKKGSIIMADEKIHRIGSFRTKAVDTTGAGDLYAAGFLYSIIRGKSIGEAGKIGSFMGSKIVQQMGAMMDEKIKNDIKMFASKSLP